MVVKSKGTGAPDYRTPVPTKGFSQSLYQAQGSNLAVADSITILELPAITVKHRVVVTNVNVSCGDETLLLVGLLKKGILEDNWTSSHVLTREMGYGSVKLEVPPGLDYSDTDNIAIAVANFDSASHTINHTIIGTEETV